METLIRAARFGGLGSILLAALVGVSFDLTAQYARGEDPHKDDSRKNGNRVGYRVLDFKLKSGEEEKTVTVAVWYPTDAEPKKVVYGGSTCGNVAVDAEPLASAGPFPLLVFSHGYGGSGLSAVFMTEALAARGWIVAAPDHNDRYCAVRIRTGQQEDFDRQAFLRQALEISRSKPDERGPYLYRVDEFKLALDKMLESEEFGKLIDPKRIAVGGHSFGGFTALGLCGAIEGRCDDRIKAALIFSSGAAGYLYTEKELAAVKPPSMYLLGEKEKETARGDMTMAKIAEKVFANVPKPRYFLEVRDGSHFSFNNRFTDAGNARLLCGTEEQFEVIRRYSIAFLEKHAAGKDDEAKVLDTQDKMLTRYRAEK